jgi:hypothetical protein
MRTGIRDHKSPPITMLHWPPDRVNGGDRSDPSALPPLASRSTRYLCAAAHIDDSFWTTCLREVYYQSNRAVAPSYGFELLPVLRHCLLARNMAIVRDAVVVGILLAAVSTFPALLWFVPAIVWVGIVVTLGRVVRNGARRVSSSFALTPLAREIMWLITVIAVGVAVAAGLGYLLYTSVYVSLPARLQITEGFDPLDLLDYAATILDGLLICALAMLPIVGHRLWQQRQRWLLGPDRRIGHVRLSSRLADIRQQQQGNTVVYSRRYPFVGSGELIHQGSLAGRLVRLNGNDQPSDAPLRESARGFDKRGFDKSPFTTQQVIDHVVCALRPLANDPDPERQIPGLSVNSRIFRTSDEAGPLFTVTEPWALAETIRLPTEPARHYLVCQVVSWYGELVTTVYIHFAVQGQSLYMQMQTTMLPPCNSRYRIIDKVDGIGPVACLRALGRSIKEAPRAALTAPLRLVLAVADLLTDSLTRSAGTASTTTGGLRFGARVSVRELGAAGTPRDAMQVQDIDKYAQIVQRRVVASMLDFLRDNDVDPTELDEKASNYFNNFNNYYNVGAWNTGSGSIVAENVAGQQNSPQGLWPQADGPGFHQPSGSPEPTQRTT